MVDWDRVEELRSKGWDWDEIADDPKVAFHPDSSVTESGRALRALYHRQRSRRERQGPAPTPTKRKDPRAAEKWTLIRALYLLVPLVGVWAGLAYVAPSPIGILVPAIPWLALALAVIAVFLIYLLLRADKRWTKVYRSTVIGGVVVGLVFAGMVGLVGALVFGCPFLPPASALASHSNGWASGGMSPWQEGGTPVVFFYGATWCPYCSASSWALYKALQGFGTLTNSSGIFSYSSPNDVYAQTPEFVLANAQYSSTKVALVVTEDTTGIDGQFPTPSGCFQSAYVTAYSGSAIPFFVINGQYVHGGSSLIDPSTLSTWAGGNSGGSPSVAWQIHQESGAAWSQVQSQAWMVMAILVKVCGTSVSAMASQYPGAWSSNTQNQVNADLSAL